MYTMSQAKNHHRIPQVYLKAWGENVWVYDKSRKSSKPRNIESILYTKFYHSIMPGDLFTLPASLDMFFSSLDSYEVSVPDKNGNEILLDNKKLLNSYWSEKDKWIIKDITGKLLPRAQKNQLLTSISQKKDNQIEEAWSKEYEAIWGETISIINKTIQRIHYCKKDTMKYEDAQKLMKYFTMFRWRSVQGPEQLKETFDKIIDLFPEEIKDIESIAPGHLEDKSFIEDIWHSILLKYFYEFLAGKGPIQQEYEKMLDSTTFIFRIDPLNRLITADNPCFQYIDSEGIIWPTFIALPGLIVQLAKKDPKHPYEYRIIDMDDIEVKTYNDIVFGKGNLIISTNKLPDVYCQ